MEVYHDLTPADGDSAVALGNFDGIHIGHHKVISLALDGARRGLVPTVLTFSENPRSTLGAEAGGRILSQKEKIRLLEQMGVERLYLLDFSTVKDIGAREFAQEVLAGVCRAKEVSCGFNFTFGRGGKAGSEELRTLCEVCGIRTFVAPAVLFEGTPVSSTRIRALIENGRMDEAAALLGRPFGYESAVLHGRKLGRKLGTPTLNQAVPPGFVMPKFGVYVSVVRLENGCRYAGVTNVGVKPTVGSDTVLAETWMPRYCGGELYGRAVRTDLLKFLRPERHFASIDELRAEILLDGRLALDYLQRETVRKA